MSHFYRLATLKLASDIELPELLPWDGGPDKPSDLSFRVGPIPESRRPGRFDPANPGDRCESYLMTYPREARVLVEAGRDVVVDPEPGVDMTQARSILMAPVQAVLWHQRGLLPLHASAVGLAGQALAIAGPSGAGKSTLAAVLAREGFEVLADDICLVDPADSARLLPTTPRLRLWRDALDHLGISAQGLPRALSRREKYVLDNDLPSLGGEWRLASVVLLSRGSGALPAIERLRGARAVAALHDAVHMLDAAHSLGLEAAVFQALTALVRSGLAVWRLMVPDDRSHLSAAAASIGALLR